MKKYKSNIQKYSLMKEESNFRKAKINCSRDTADYVRNFYATDLEVYESMFVIYLNAANNTAGWIKLSQGGINGTVVDNRLIMKYAIESLCSSIIIVHNHPTGRLEPSSNDKQLTEKLIKVCKFHDIPLLDHVILTKDDHYSFADNGLI